MKLRYGAAFTPSWRLIPSRFPPISLFDTVATQADALAVMELEGWTNDRLMRERVALLPEDQVASGRPNFSVILASFLHVALGGSRFNGVHLGAWYATAAIRTGIIEVAHHLRREAAARAVPSASRTYRSYSARLRGADYRDIRGEQAELSEVYASDTYAASQRLGEQVRANGHAGVLYDSVRHAGGQNAAVFRLGAVVDVLQADHYQINVAVGSRRIEVGCPRPAGA